MALLGQMIFLDFTKTIRVTKFNIHLFNASDISSHIPSVNYKEINDYQLHLVSTH